MTSERQDTGLAEPATRFRTYRRLAYLTLFGIAAALVWGLWRESRLTPQGILELIAQNATLAPFVFVAIYAVAALFLIPTLPLNIGAGFVWGPLYGALYSLLGSTMGACGAFLFARTTFGQPLARSFEKGILKRIMSVVSADGWKIVAFARINPVVPTGVVNFLFGLTALGFWTFLWASFLFAFPLSFAFSYLGFSTGSLMLQGDISIILRIIGVILGIGLLFFLGRKVLPKENAREAKQQPPTP